MNFVTTNMEKDQMELPFITPEEEQQLTEEKRREEAEQGEQSVDEELEELLDGE